MTIATFWKQDPSQSCWVMFLGGALHIHGIAAHRARKKILGRPDEIFEGYPQ